MKRPRSSAIGKGQFCQLGRESRNPTRENSTLSFEEAFGSAVQPVFYRILIIFFC